MVRRRLVAAAEGELELQFGEPVGGGDVGQPHIVRERAERGEATGASASASASRRDAGQRVVDQLFGAAGGELGGEVGRGEVGDLQHGVHERAERGAGRQVGQRRR